MVFQHFVPIFQVVKPNHTKVDCIYPYLLPGMTICVSHFRNNVLITGSALDPSDGYK